MSASQRDKYQTPEYRRAYVALKQAQKAGRWLQCVQPECVMPSRWISPDQKAHVGHDDSGLVIIGPVHERCNTRDGAIRGNRMRGLQRRRWAL
jgi:hypothetical protein